MKTVDELKQIVKDVKARGDNAPSQEELPCRECPIGDCDNYTCNCLHTIEVWCAEQEAAK